MHLMICFTILLVHILLIVKANERKTVEFDWPSWEEEGCDECWDYFEYSQDFEDDVDNNSVKIQTDRCVYKSGETIKFRVWIKDKDLARNSKISYSTAIDDDLTPEVLNVIEGVFIGEVHISEIEPTSYWILAATNGNESIKRACLKIENIEEDYEVEMEAPENVSIMDDVINVVITAHHKSGTPVDGNVFVNLSFFAFETTVRLNETFNMVNGKGSFNLDVKNYSDYMGEKTDYIEVDVEVAVVERSTGTKIYDSATIGIHAYRYLMMCVNDETCDSFEPNKEEDLLVQIANMDGSSPNDTKSTVELIYVPNNSGKFYPNLESEANMSLVISKNLTFKGHMNETGFVNFKKVSLPALPNNEGHVSNYFLKVKYLDDEQKIGSTFEKGFEP